MQISSDKFNCNFICNFQSTGVFCEFFWLTEGFLLPPLLKAHCVWGQKCFKNACIGHLEGSTLGYATNRGPLDQCLHGSPCKQVDIASLKSLIQMWWFQAAQGIPEEILQACINTDFLALFSPHH